MNGATQDLAKFPAELKALPQWVLWRYETRDGKPTKPPINPRTGSHASTTDPSTWTTFSEALSFLESGRVKAEGVGFVFTDQAGYVGVDLDKCIDSTGRPETWVVEVVNTLHSYTEYSPSGRGFHTLVKAKPPPRNRKGQIEIYGRGRYFTVTGQHVESTPITIEARQTELDAVVAKYLPATTPPDPTRSPKPPMDLSDWELFEKASNAKNGPAFTRLWGGDASGHGDDDSAADLALLCHLAFWTGGDPARMDRLFRLSGLMRAKWEERPDYRERTIQKALELTRETYSPAAGGKDHQRTRNAPHQTNSPDSGDFEDIGMAIQKWEPPMPLESVEVLPFPIEAFLPWIAQWVKEEAEATQTPPDMAALSCLGVLAAASAKKYRIEAREGWQEPLNLMVATVLPPGERKSAVFSAATAPIYEFEKEHAPEWRAEFERALAQYEIAEKKLTQAKKRPQMPEEPVVEQHEEENVGANRQDVGVLLERALEMAEKFSTIKKPVYPRLIADDITPEKIVGLLSDQGGKLALFSAEGGIFSILAGRYSDGAPVIDAVLKGHAGEPIRVDRVSRPSETVDFPALTISLSVQPGVIRDLADTKQFLERGLVARFLFALPVSRVGSRAISCPPVSKTTADIYTHKVKALLEIPENRDARGEIIPTILRLSPEADKRLRESQEQLEPRLGPNGDLASLAGWGGKLAGALLRIAGLLHLAEYITADHHKIPPEVSQDSMDSAILLSEYLISHAKAAHQMLGDGPVREARKILEWIEKYKIRGFSKRQCWQALRGHVRKTKDLDAPLLLLQEHGYIRPAPGEAEPRPGRPSERFEVNPLSHNDQNSQNPSATC